MIVILTHAVFMNNKDIYGPPHAISSYLDHEKQEYLFIKHRLDGDGRTRVEYYNKGKIISSQEKGLEKRFPSFIQYGSELLINLQEVLKKGRKHNIIIGVDPLNALAANILKFFGVTKKTVYFSADFALIRFNNPILNFIYLNLDSLASKWSNETWSVSKRIVEHRSSCGLAENKNIYFPNAPFFNDVKRYAFNKCNKHDLVIVSALNKGIAFDLVIDAVFQIKKKISDVKLILIGAGVEEEYLRGYVKKKNLQNSVIFLGPLSHSDMFLVLARSGIGIALYTDADPNHFRYFSDPMKVRDYLASGLPTIISGNSGIGEELEQNHAGKIVSLKTNDITIALLKLLENENLQRQMRQNAIAMAKKYDTYSLLKTRIG